MSHFTEHLLTNLRATDQNGLESTSQLGACMETFGNVDVVSGSGTVFHKTQLFSFVLNV